MTVVSEVAPAEALVPAPSAPQAPLLPRSLSLVLRAPSGVAADVADLDLATAAALLRAVLAPTALSAGVGAR